MPGRASRYAMIVIAVIGLGLASYLTYIHYSGELASLPCVKGSSGISPCEAVQSSVYSELAGVPVALLGAIGYLLILATLLVREREETRLIALGLTAVGFGFSAYLTGREVFSLEKICEWCVSSAILMTILVILASWRFLRGGIDGAGDIPPGMPPEADTAAGSSAASDEDAPAADVPAAG